MPLLLVALLTGCGVAAPGPGTPAPSPTAPTSPSLTTSAPGPSRSGTPDASLGPASPGPATELITGLTSPWGLTVTRDGAVLVSERDTGLIMRIADGRMSELGRIEGVAARGEGGLLGITMSPEGQTLYAYLTTARDNRIVARELTGSTLGPARTVLDGIPAAPTHNGGQLAFGPDGYLYVGTGDAQARGDAQETGSLAGKILRLTPEGAPAPGNPFGNEVFSYGHRNVQGLAFDDAGRLWASEFGAQSQDELNLITSGGNYGWPAIEGDQGEANGMIAPARVWPTSEASPSGLAFVAGSLWMGGLRGARLWQIPLTGEQTEQPIAHLMGERGRLRGVLAFEGDVVVATSNTDGRGTPAEGDDRLLRIGLTRT